jgi:hypothetical protein
MPHEVLLAIIVKVEYCPHQLNDLSLTNRLLHDLMRTYRTGIIREIAAQQFALESVLGQCESPSPCWLRDLRGQKQFVEEILATCPKPVYDVPSPRHLLSDEQANRFARVGLYLTSQHLAKGSGRQRKGGFGAQLARLRGAIGALPTIGLLCLHFASSILTEAVAQKANLSPSLSKTHAAGLRMATEFLVCWSGYIIVWPLLAEFSDYDGDRKGMLQEVKDLAEEGIILLVKFIMVRHLQDGAEGFDVGLQAEVERRLGGGEEAVAGSGDARLDSDGKSTVDELDLAVIQTLKMQTLDDAAIAQALASLQ